MKPTSAVRTDDAKYDIVKFLLSIIVVAAHAHLTPAAASIWQRNIVPIFLLISSTFLFSKLSKLPPELHNQAIRKFLTRNLSLYFFWLVVVLPLNLLFRGPVYQEPTVFRFLHKLVRMTLFGDVFVASWYLPASIIGTLIIYFLSKKCGNTVALIISILAYIFATVRASYYCLFENNLLVWQIYHYYELLFDFSPLSFPYALIWIYIGKCFGENRIKDRPVWLIIVLLILSCIGQDLEGLFTRSLNGAYYNESYFMTIPVSVFFFFLLRKLPPVSFPFSARLRHFSTFIYVTHNMPLLTYGFFLPWLRTPDGALLLFILTISTCTVLFLLAEWYRERFAHQKFAKLLHKVF